MSCTRFRTGAAVVHDSGGLEIPDGPWHLIKDFAGYRERYWRRVWRERFSRQVLPSLPRFYSRWSSPFVIYTTATRRDRFIKLIYFLRAPVRGRGWSWEGVRCAFPTYLLLPEGWGASVAGEPPWRVRQARSKALYDGYLCEYGDPGRGLFGEE